MKAISMGLLTAVVILCFCGSSLGGAENGEGGLTLYAEPTDGEGKEWAVLVTPSLMILGEGRAVALLLAAEVPPGFAIAEVSLENGSHSMNLTVSYGENGRFARILLDGAPISAEEGLLRIRVEGEGKCALNLTSPDGKETYLYCMQEGGEIITYPLKFENSEECTSTEEETGEPTTETVTEEMTQEREPISALPAYPTLVGCRETTSENGMFAVQFLFYGGNMAPPVYCIEGQGSMTLELERRGEIFSDGSMIPPPSGEAWICATFRGALDERIYRFGIMTEAGEVLAVYENGKFVGFGV